MVINETERLRIRELTERDAAFALHIYNTKPFLQFVGDRHIRTIEQAAQYLVDGPMKMYKEKGVGLYLVELKACRTPIGLCGLIKRDHLEEIDIGYGYLEAFFGKGYAFESCQSVLAYAKKSLHLQRVIAFTNSDNAASIKLLERLGLRFDKVIAATDNDPEMDFYSIDFK